MGDATIQITFSALKMLIDVNFSIREKNAPYLVSNEDMIDNVLDISLQGRYLHAG